MEAIILLAGYGSRLDRQDLPHKTLLPFGEETLLSRHLKCLQALGIRKTHLILGHNAPALQTYVQDLNLDLPYISSITRSTAPPAIPYQW
jgi:choline kinase